MKMEVLSVQNQFQGQFGVIGTPKVKDWASPLTPPPPSPPLRRLRSQGGSKPSNHQQPQQQKSQTDIGDVVDGSRGEHHHNNYYRNHHAHHFHQQSNRPQATIAMEAATATNVKAATTSTGGIAAAMNARAAFNNNVNYLCCDAMPQGATPPSNNIATPTQSGDDIDAAAVNALSQRLQAVLRQAKSRHLACTEVSLPYDLTPRIAAEIIKVSEREPCGVRGCTIFIEFEDEPNNTRRIASLKVDPNTVSTFELYLTLKHDRSGWTSLLPQFLKNLTRSSTIMISPDFNLTKNKLYAFE